MANANDFTPANENHNPFLYPETALAELYRLRREVTRRNARSGNLETRRIRRDALEELDQKIELCLHWL